ncbi:deoxyribodipyrimidine photolyase-related protein [Jatrophihabitans endophyticus]|uniref:Deoxyribodipyrimidine photolyase-related protein n=1 Tax=Jatrophihabitans endophyticus TaxID=1206085 RepID=A0A1M5HY61_9ACTN|nr:cryptochrome/photolyase family protein [Jatrophihabitans endophyticus]SHG20936.1 deoxyribodipyrimidine photolyase-related protein [Jatrophihabitans endophyticus]
MTERRWLFGDQLGPHFLDHPDDAVLLIESRAVFRRRRFHRQKAHLVLSAMRHRAAELGERCRYVRADTYGEVVRRTRDRLTVCRPTSHAALDLVRSLDVEVTPARGFATSSAEFAAWVEGRGKRRLLLEDFYRDARRRLDVLMDGSEPAGGTWNFDHENREPPPRQPTLGVDEPWWPTEDEIDDEVRHDLDRWERDGDVSFIGKDGPRRFAASRDEALHAVRDFAQNRLPTFGAYEDAILRADPWMSHSLLSAPLNFGLLDPVEVVHRVEEAYRAGDVPIASAEGFVRQLIGWRDYVWHLYWQQPRSYRRRNELGARGTLPAWFADLDHEHVDAACLSDTLRNIERNGWVHHIPRLMVLGNYAMQRGWRPSQVTDWFHRAFVDGYDWVMVPNVVGMSQYADGGVMATKPYAGGGAYIDRMSDYCGGCRYDPKVRVGDDACPFTAGYWAFLDRNRDALQGNQRIAQPLRGLDRLKDLDELRVQERERGSRAP